jgi:membrane protease YdiL (CAAX protease family)
LNETRLPPAGWYRDPAGQFPQRYWDGERWTDGVSDKQGSVSQSPLPPDGASAAWAALEDHRRGFSAWIVLVAVGAFLLSSIVGGLAGYLASQVNTAAGLLVGASVNYGGLYLTCVLVSRRRGTGNLADDFGLQYRSGDWWRGVLISFGARIAGIVVVAILVAISEDLAGSNTAAFDEHRDSLGFVLCAAVVAVVMAPFFEELFFRGLILQSLEGSFPAPVAIGLQGALFGLAHVGGAEGVGNIGLVLGLAAAGVVFGICARRYHRIVPGMIAHACFNLPLIVVLLVNR